MDSPSGRVADPPGLPVIVVERLACIGRVRLALPDSDSPHSDVLVLAERSGWSLRGSARRPRCAMQTPAPTPAAASGTAWKRTTCTACTGAGRIRTSS